VDAIVDYYLAEAGRAAALGFVEALDRALRHIGEHPAAGSPRYGHELDLPGLRVWPVRRFPHMIFYVEREAEIDVWRILHGRRDIPEWLRPPGSEEG
jgi:toxin ParE1/3/4